MIQDSSAEEENVALSEKRKGLISVPSSERRIHSRDSWRTWLRQSLRVKRIDVKDTKNASNRVKGEIYLNSDLVWGSIHAPRWSPRNHLV